MTIGGAPISQMFADEIGADGYGSDASNAVDLFLYLMGKGEAPRATLRAGVKPAAAVAVARPADNVVKYQLLYWRNLPASLKVWDDFGELKVDLPARFAERIDLEALKLGLTTGDAYTAQLHWGDEQSRPGVPEDIATILIKELEPSV
jgi:hypothetical protein